MKLFWKIFCSTVIIAAITCSVGGYFLIHSQFMSSLEREVDAAYTENDILCQTTGRELQSLDAFSSVREQVPSIAEGITLNISEGKIAYCISDKEGNTLYRNCQLEGSRDIFSEITEGRRGYEIYKNKEQYYVHAVRPANVQGEVLFLENFRDITALFNTKKEQYTTFVIVMAALFAGVGLVTFFISSLLLSPLKKLSLAVKQMAGGTFGQQLHIKSHDEIGQLASDFEQMSAKLDEMVNELKEYSRRQQDFVDNFSHELKTPLTSIIGYADMLRSKKMEPKRTAACANYIFTEGKRLESLSRKLMDMIVLEKQDFEFRPVHIEKFLNEMREILAPALQKQGIVFYVKAESEIVSIEPDLMKTVLINLLDNARKAVEEDGVIALTGRKLLDGAYCITVEDNGKGIPKEELSKITEAFYMVDKSRARAQGGAGLGLALCSKIIELHHGKLEFASREGRGMSVSIYLKRRTDTSKEKFPAGKPRERRRR